MNIISYLVQQNNNLKTDLRLGRMYITPQQLIVRALRAGTMAGVLFASLVFLFLGKGNASIGIPVLVGLVGGYGTYWYILQTPKLAAQKVATDINREVLFAGRFLLVKLHSGVPLINAIVEASKSYGVANKYFLEIVRDIELGTSLEVAIEKAMNNSPSMHWRKVLFQISNALRLGIDVTHSLESVLEDISYDYLLQIQRYGKKLSTVTLFYLLVGVVFPSLGMTIVTVLMGFTNIQLSFGFFAVVLLVVVFLQFIFMRTFAHIRPKVNL
jgi:pilus assembly protein TadC